MSSTNIATADNITTADNVSIGSSGALYQAKLPKLHSNINTKIQINSLPYNNQNSMWTGIGAINDEAIQPTTVELKTIDGKRHIVRMSYNDSLEDIEERTIVTKRFSFKFPFIATEKKTYVHFKMCNYYRNLNDILSKAKEFDVDCNLSAFCKLIGLSYRGFSEALLEDVIENG